METPFPSYAQPIINELSFDEIDKLLEAKRIIIVAMGKYNNKLTAKDNAVILIKTHLKSLVSNIPSRENRDQIKYDALVRIHDEIIKKINSSQINTESYLKVENDKYNTLMFEFISGHSVNSYGLIPEGLNDPGGHIQAFYYDNTNLDKFKAAFAHVEGITRITATSADDVANFEETLPAGFRLPSTITHLGHFGKRLTSLPENFAIPDSITHLEHFGSSLTSFPHNLVLPDAITHFGHFGYLFTKLPENFKFPDRIIDLGSFGFSLTQLPENFKLPNSIMHLNHFGLSLTSLSRKFKIPPSVTNFEYFGSSLTQLPENFKFPTSIVSLQAFGSSLTSLQQGFAIPSSISVLGGFGQSIISLQKDQHLLTDNNIEITWLPMEYIKDISNVGKWHIGSLLESKAYTSYVANTKRGYGQLPWGANDPDGRIQAFYYDPSNLEKFKDAFQDVEGIWDITATSAEKVATSTRRIPSFFRLPSTITHLGDFGRKLDTLPPNFKLPNSITHLEGFGYSLDCLPENFQLPNSVTHIGFFGRFLLSIPENFVLPTSVIHLGYFAFSAEYLPKNFKIPSSVIHLNNFGFSLKSLPINFKIPVSVIEINDSFKKLGSFLKNNHLLLLDGAEITSKKIAYMRNPSNSGKWYIGLQVGQSYVDAIKESLELQHPTDILIDTKIAAENFITIYEFDESTEVLTLVSKENQQ